MTPQKKLKVLRKTAVHNLSKIALLIDAVSPQGPLRQVDKSVAFVCIELLNTWANFSRAFFLSSVLNPKNERGIRYSVCGVSNYNDALRTAINQFRTPLRQLLPTQNFHRRDEPTWHNFDQLIGACSSIQHSNLNDIRTAFSGTSRLTFAHLPVLRNYFAHRNRDTKKSALDVMFLNYGVISKTPSLALLDYSYSGLVPVISGWISDVGETIKFLCF